MADLRILGNNTVNDVLQDAMQGLLLICIDSENYAHDHTPKIYTLRVVCLKRNATQDDIDDLSACLCIIAGKKVIVK